MAQVLRGVEETFNAIIEKQNNNPREPHAELESLQEVFNLIFQKWSLEILYTIMLKDTKDLAKLKKS
jgi:DNA-binding HxlR family transcriptional regulator